MQLIDQAISFAILRPDDVLIVVLKVLAGYLFLKLIVILSLLYISYRQERTSMRTELASLSFDDEELGKLL